MSQMFDFDRGFKLPESKVTKPDSPQVLNPNRYRETQSPNHSWNPSDRYRRRKIDRISVLGLDLDKPIEIEISSPPQMGEYCIIENDELSIVSIGINYDEAIEDFEDYFKFLYETFYQEEDENLEGEGLKIKRVIESLVGRRN